MSTKNSGGLAELVFAVLLIYILYKIIPVYNKAAAIVITIIHTSITGAKVFAGLLLLFLIYRVIRFLHICFHTSPLTEDEVDELAKGYANYYIENTYDFKSIKSYDHTNLQSLFTRTNQWHDIEQPVSYFPINVAAFLTEKNKNYIIIAIEKDGIVRRLWTYKVDNGDIPALFCDINDIIRVCRLINGYTIMRFTYPLDTDTFYSAGEVDKQISNSCCNYVAREGYNWLDFFCQNGKFKLYKHMYSTGFEVDGMTRSEIIDKLDISPEMNIELYSMYRGSYKKTSFTTAVGATVILFIVFILLFNIGAGIVRSVKNHKSAAQEPVAVAEVVDETP